MCHNQCPSMITTRIPQDEEETQQKLVEKQRAKWMSSRDSSNRLKNRFFRKCQINDYYIHPRLRFPTKFKCPDFKKYDGKSYLYHLKVYGIGMGQYDDNNKLLVETFPRSLLELIWPDSPNLQFQKSRSVQIWPTYSLSSTIHLKDHAWSWATTKNDKKPSENFREYAQRWRQTSSLIHLILTEKKMSRFAWALCRQHIMTSLKRLIC